MLTVPFAEYIVSMPNMYARGILWGKMVLELGDTCTARNERNGFLADLTFKTRVSAASPARPCCADSAAGLLLGHVQRDRGARSTQ